MGDVDDLAALRETMARLIEEAHHLRAVTDKLLEEGRRLRHELRHLVERDRVAATIRPAA
jgi:regulator of replication initiation timing